MSASAASIRCAAIFALCDDLVGGERQRAEPPVTIEREPLEPMPNATRSVSPSMNTTSCGIDAELLVQDLLEHGLVPLAVRLGAQQQQRAVPLGWKRISAYSGTGPAACSMALATPMPRSLPRAFDSSARAPKAVIRGRQRLIHDCRENRRNRRCGPSGDWNGMASGRNDVAAAQLDRGRCRVRSAASSSARSIR